MQSLWHRLERFSVRITPAVVTAALVLLAAVPLRIPGAAALMPAFALISIYYWETFCPGSLPAIFLAALGLLEDTLSGLPMGVTPVVNIIFALLIARERDSFGKAQFGAVLFGFMLLSFVATALEWIIMSFYMSQVLPLPPHLLKWVATCLCYPPMHMLLTRLWRALAG